MASTRKSLQPDLRFDLLQRVSATLARLLPETRSPRVCVGLSGGLDSIVLLHVLSRLVPLSELSAVHVHHGLSDHADAWARFALDYAASLGVHCTVERVTVLRGSGQGLEGSARTARYHVFAGLDCDVLALAHHGNDQAETLLFNLLRGSGLAGLAAMPMQRPLADSKKLIRPLLAEPRAVLQDYADAHGLAWVEDESNDSLAFSRNHLRHEILPLLAVRYPSVVRSLNRTAAHVAEAAGLLAELAEADLALCLVEGAFDLGRAAALTEQRQRHALRYFLHSAGIVLETRGFDSLWQSMSTARAETMPMLIWRGRAVRRYRDRLYITPADCTAGPRTVLTGLPVGDLRMPGWPGILRVETGLGIAPQYLCGELELRPWSGSALLRLQANRHRRSLKHLAQELGLPPWLRESAPLLYLNGQLAAVPGLGVDAAFQTVADEPGLRLGWHLSA